MMRAPWAFCILWRQKSLTQLRKLGQIKTKLLTRNTATEVFSANFCEVTPNSLLLQGNEQLLGNHDLGHLPLHHPAGLCICLPQAPPPS